MARAASSFPVPAFTVNEHGGVAGGHALNQLINVTQERTIADHTMLQIDLGAKLLVFEPQTFEIDWRC